MSIATSSKTSTTVAALAALGLSAAAGFAYWGVQNWDKFNSDYYKDGYVQEADGIAYNDEEKKNLAEEMSGLESATTSEDGTEGMVPVTPGYRIPADIVPGYRLPGDMTPPTETMTEPSETTPEPVMDEMKKKQMLLNSDVPAENMNSETANTMPANTDPNEPKKPAEDVPPPANTNPNTNPNMNVDPNKKEKP